MRSAVHSSDRIVVVGGGVAGLAVALRLAQAGRPVTVLERSRLGSGASTRNQGWLHSGAVFALWQPTVARLCHESLRATLGICPECVEPGHDGALFVVSEPGADRWTKAWADCEIPHAPVPPSELTQRVPYLVAPDTGRAFELPDRSIRVDVLLRRLAEAAEQAGAEIRPATEAVRLLRVKDEVRGVETNLGEELTARLVVLAANARNVTLLPESSEGRRLRFLKLHLIATAAGPGLWPVCLPEGDGFYHLPHPPGAVFGTERWIEAAGPDDDRPEPTELDRIRDDAARLFPGCGALTGEVAAWAGTTLQAVPAGRPDGARAEAWPAVVDHAHEATAIRGVVSVFPGRATLWPWIADEALRVVESRLGRAAADVPAPPWAVDSEAEYASDRVDMFHCQRCGRVQRRGPGLRPPVCCNAVMVRAAETVFRGDGPNS